MMNKEIFEKIKELVARVECDSPFYREKFKSAGITAKSLKEFSDFEKIPFSDKAELRVAYPLGLMSVPRSEVVRIHSSSGTTGSPVIIPYTKKDVEDWTAMFARCYETAGVTCDDVVQVTPGYGLWTAGIGFQAGAERVGAMVVPMGPGNTDKQLQMMTDLESTVFCSTSSYALLIAEEVQKRGLRDRIKLKKGIIGSERWGDLMRGRIESELGIELFDIYGLTEVYGPGIAIDCPCHCGMHYWDDYLYFEIIDSDGMVLPHGETGELVITTLCKEGAPLVRYRTHDLTRIIPSKCKCGSVYPMIDRIVGRTDDMIKVKGVNIYPANIDTLLKDVDGASSEYQIIIDHKNGRDTVLLKVEKKDGADKNTVERTVCELFKKRIGIAIEVDALCIGEIPRSEKKSRRVFDYREC
ncbi:MAG: Phenylacetate-coenzyme A ligase [Firmicutes bacterium ADurb.Bin193]|nr:MAG: Phenylacetate-coenzyme A ligase [Firmicutes bacterium ADurb.Bin193]